MQTIERLTARLPWLLWLALALIAGAECLTVLNGWLGIGAHLALLFGLLTYAGCGELRARRDLALGLALAPLVRVISLTLPLARFPQLLWYPILALPLLAYTGLVARQCGLGWRDRGLRGSGLALQLALATGGLGVGALEYLILRPAPAQLGTAWPDLAAAALVLVLFTGFTEELIFRGLLQTLAQPALGPRAGICFVSILFAVLHIGYLSVVDVVFVGLVGAIFAWVAGRSGSLLGVALAHGLANITLFLLMPYVMRQAQPELLAGVAALIFVGSLAFVVVLGVLSWQAEQAPPQPQIAANGHP